MEEEDWNRRVEGWRGRLAGGAWEQKTHTEDAFVDKLCSLRRGRARFLDRIVGGTIRDVM
jgi:hypothetical protein